MFLTDKSDNVHLTNQSPSNNTQADGAIDIIMRLLGMQMEREINKIYIYINLL